MDRVTRRLSDMELHVSRDPISEARARWVRAVRSADRERGYARLAIPGGSAAAVVRHTRIILGDVWRRSRLTYTDERCVPFDAQDSNRGSLHRDGTFIPTDPPAVELSLFQTGEAPDEAVRRVAAALGRDFDAGLDVLLLGMGPEGHIASLFPQRDPHEGLVAHIEDSPRPPPASHHADAENPVHRAPCYLAGDGRGQTARAVASHRWRHHSPRNGAAAAGHLHRPRYPPLTFSRGFRGRVRPEAPEHRVHGRIRFPQIRPSPSPSPRLAHSGRSGTFAGDLFDRGGQHRVARR